MRIVAVLRAVAVVVLSFPTLTRAQAAAEPERFTGTVKSDSGVAISTASVTVTPAGAGFSASVTVRTNTAGRWTATLPNRSPEYFITVSAIGWTQVRTTVKSAGPGSTTPVDVDVTLKARARTAGTRAHHGIAAAATAARRDRPGRRADRKRHSRRLGSLRRRGSGRSPRDDRAGSRHHDHERSVERAAGLLGARPLERAEQRDAQRPAVRRRRRSARHHRRGSRQRVYI